MSFNKMVWLGFEEYRFFSKFFNFNLTAFIIFPSLSTGSIIDIIEPVEELSNIFKKTIKTIEKIKTKLFALIKKNKNKKKFIEFNEIKTGKHNNDVISKKGRFNFYSCAKNVKKSDFNSFNGEYIIVSGNGAIYSWYENGSFDLYQRCYALKPTKDFFTSLFSVENFIDNIRNKISGSVIKYVKLKDLKTIPVVDNIFETNLQTIYKISFLINKIEERLASLKAKKIKFLVIT